MQISRHALLLLIVFVLLFCGFNTAKGLVAGNSLAASVSESSFGQLVLRVLKDDREKIDRAIFVGDIMLARDVEKRLPTLLPGSPFTELAPLFNSKVVIGNFEASIPSVHKPTPSMVMVFSVAVHNLDVLVKGGLTHLSLANNHSLDHGKAAYNNTVNELKGRGFMVGGHPTMVGTSSITYFTVEDKTFALLSINAVFGYPDEASWRPVLAEAEEKSEAVVAYIHWGDEYELTHNPAQERFAKTIIDAGADLVVGHHPHVVQDIGVYNGVPIFYSLGNLVFDQYWMKDVQEGLVLELVKEKNKWQINLQPVESRSVKIQPRLMIDDEREFFLIDLANRSDYSLYESISAGTLTLQF